MLLHFAFVLHFALILHFAAIITFCSVTKSFLRSITVQAMGNSARFVVVVVVYWRAFLGKFLGETAPSFGHVYGLCSLRPQLLTIQRAGNARLFGRHLHISQQRYFVFVSTVEVRTLHIQERPYMNTFCESILKKIGLTYAHFQYNSRKCRLSPFYCDVFFEKINNKKVITTACNFWRQIACSFQVYGRTNHFCAKSTRKTLFWTFRLFSPDQHYVTKCFFRQFFQPLYEDKGQKITIINGEYLGDTCFNWA